MPNQVCLPTSHLYSYVILLVILTAFVTTTYVCSKNEGMSNTNLSAHLSRDQLQEKLAQAQAALHKTQLANQECERNLFETKRMLGQQQRSGVQNALLDKIYNPLVSPERMYPGGRVGLPSHDDYQLIGYLFSDMERFPLFGRHRYPGRSDKWEYYAIDETRNRLKLPLSNKNFNEMYDGDSISIPTIQGTFNVKLYEYEQPRYNPNL